MVKEDELIKEDFRKLCGWVEHSYHLNLNFVRFV